MDEVSKKIRKNEPLVKVKAKSAKHAELNIKRYKRDFINTKLVFRSIFCSVFR